MEIPLTDIQEQMEKKESKLELKHLAPYLPYELKVAINDGFVELNGLGSSLISVKEINAVDAGMYVGINEIKPVLRPLSDLTKEADHKGDKFVPMRKLAHEMYGYGLDYVNSNQLKEYNQNGFYGLMHDDLNTYIYFKSQETNYGNDTRFGLSQRGENMLYTDKAVSYQLEMFNKLFEWHFDVFGLIEKGLASPPLNK